MFTLRKLALADAARTLVISSVMALGLWVAPSLPAQPRVGERAPDIALPDVHGDTTKLSTFRGHPVIVKFWATWCPTCRTELPELLVARDAHRDAGLVVLTIDSDDRPAKVDAFVQRLLGIPGVPVLIDRSRRVQRRYEIPALPTTVFLDSGGVIRVFHTGAMRASELAIGVRAIVPPFHKDD